MRILLALEPSGGGSGRHVIDLASGLAASGHDVTVAWSPDRAEQGFVDALSALSGIASQPVPMRRAVGVHDWSSLRALARFVRRHGPYDILHGHSSKAGALVRMLPRSIPGLRVYTPHAFRTLDPGLGRLGRLAYGGIERSLTRTGDRIIAVSRFEYEHARALGFPERDLRLVVNGVTGARLADRPGGRSRLGLDESEIAVGFVGRLAPQKDPLRFVDAVMHAHARDRRIRGVVMGDGPLAAQARARADGEAIRFTGWCDARPLLPSLDIFAMTSRYEAMPYTLLEAVHAGVPILTTDIGGAAEAVPDGRNGIVVDLDTDATGIGDRICEIAADADRRRAMQAEARALRSFVSAERMVRQTLAVYGWREREIRSERHAG